MPIMNGYEFLKTIRRKDDTTPALIISSYDDKTKLNNAIKLNLLEYMSKPYELDELKTTLQNFTQLIKKNSLLKYQLTSNCYYDPAIKSIIDNDKQNKLTSYEAQILEYLLKYKGKLVSYEILLDILNSSNQRSLVSLIHKLKKKLPKDLIQNIKDIGYILKLK